MTDADDRYCLRVLTRCRVAGLRLKPGATLLVPADKLGVAAHLTRCGTARPADERTRLDVALHLLLADPARPKAQHGA
jgi:hypothetical protein